MIQIQPKRILYISDLAYGDAGTDRHRMESIRELGHEVVSISSLTEFAQKMGSLLPMRVARKLFQVEFGWNFLSNQICDACERYTFDAMWIDKGIRIPSSVFKIFRTHFPNAKIVGYSPDDMMTRANHSRSFGKNIPLYDLFFTTKSYNVQELENLGCPKAHFISNAYQPAIHRSMTLTEKEKAHYGGAVVFIGSWEKERSRAICFLADCGVSVKVWGKGGWLHFKNPAPSLSIEPKGAYGDDYAKILTASDISLCFLRKENRDLQTTRSIEIPACGSFMLAERTDEHLSLFEEGKEAEFFSSNQELLQKVNYYTAHPEERKAIAEAGRKRCIAGGYSNVSRMKEMLSIVFAK